MDLFLDIQIEKLSPPIQYNEKILLTGSCFTEHIGGRMDELKFPVLQNPNGILFNPHSVCQSLLSYVQPEIITQKDLFQINEIWHSWNFHSLFSDVDADKALTKMNAALNEAHTFLEKARWVIITLGSSFCYRLTHQAVLANKNLKDIVANCHRAPAHWFEKELLTTEEIKELLENCLKELKAFNPSLQFIFTISPVRHARDGVVENNRSKARLIEAVHFITTKFESAYYFPAYELVIDVLRDYRFYDIDLIHPNYAATDFVFQKFKENCIDEKAKPLMEEIKKIVTASKHKAFHPDTNAHQQFLKTHYEQAKILQQQYPFLDLKNELKYFTSSQLK